jgi:hypothetical protein
MNQKKLLRRFEHSTIAHKTTNSTQTRELYITVDFNESKFYLKANWNSLVHACNDAKMAFLSRREGQIEIGMNIFPRGLVDLEDVSNDGLILFLKGAFNDGAQINSCTGMLVFSHMQQKNGNTWFLSCYLYEPGTGYSEIKFKFPVCDDGELIRKIFKYS